MKAAPLLISWHNDNAPIYSAHFEPHGKGRLATSGGDNNVRLWKIESDGEERKATYLTTLIKHTQAVNVVRFSPKGEMLGTAGDDGNALLWVPSESAPSAPAFGEDNLEDKETWRIKHMCRSVSEIYDLAWSPDGMYFITGSMDNVARIYNANTGQIVRQIAEHNHYVQGVAWDPLNDYVATQSSDRSVHIYNLKTKDGEFTLQSHNKVSKMDLPGRRISASPAPSDLVAPKLQSQSSADNVIAPATPAASVASVTASGHMQAPASPAPSMSVPGTPNSLALPMNPPTFSHSRRSSFGASPSVHRSGSPAPSIPLPAVRPMENSPNPFMTGFGVRNASIYHNETYTSFFRRLTFAPDGSLLFTPAGQYKTSHPSKTEGAKPVEEVQNTVYVYTRAGFNKPPIAHLPGHKKPSIAVKCSPIFYTYRTAPKKTIQTTIDTSSNDDDAGLALPESVIPTSIPNASMYPPPPAPSNAMPSPSELARPASGSNKDGEGGKESSTNANSAFALPYRIVYAVATQDSILVYDTQQLTPLCIVSNLHFATFTDLTWSNDGLTLIMSSSDGFCSSISFAPGELGTPYTEAIPTYHSHQHHHSNSNSSNSHQRTTSNPSNNNSFSGQPSPAPTPTSSFAILSTHPKPLPVPTTSTAASPAPSSTSAMGINEAAYSSVTAQSPTKSRSNSASSIATTQSLQSSYMPATSGIMGNSPTPSVSNVPSVSGAAPSAPSSLPLSMNTPPMTPMPSSGTGTGGGNGHSSQSGGLKRETSESEREDRQGGTKKRRIAPTLVSENR